MQWLEPLLCCYDVGEQEDEKTIRPSRIRWLQRGVLYHFYREPPLYLACMPKVRTCDCLEAIHEDAAESGMLYVNLDPDEKLPTEKRKRYQR